MKTRAIARKILSSAISIFTSVAFAAPTSLTYQGRILKSDGTPVNTGTLSFLFEITNPSGSCVIYREQVNGISMNNSGGVFDVPIGLGSQTYPDLATNPTFNILSAFENNTLFVCDGNTPYNAAQSDTRKLRVHFHDGTGWKLITPDNEIRSVPFAGHSAVAGKAKDAEALSTHPLADFVLKGAISTCTLGQYLSFDGTNFSCQNDAGGAGMVSDVNVTAPLTKGGTASIPVIGISVGTAAGTVAAGDDARFTDARTPIGAAGGDLSGTYPNPAVAKIRGVTVSATAPTSGHFLKYDGAQWLSSAVAISDVTSLSASLATYHTTAAFNAAVGSANCAVHQTPYWNSVSGSFQCQAINVSLAGDVSGAIGATSVDKIKGVAVDTTGLASGNILKYDGTKWAPAADNNTGTVTSVATGTGLSGGPITSSGTISLANTAVTPAVYGSTTNVATFTVDAQGRLTAAANAAIAFPVTSVATKTGAVTLDVGDINSAASKYFTYKPNNVACTDGQVMKWIAANSRWECAADTDTNAGGTVTSVATGTGLTGGPITGTGTIALANTAVTAGSYTRASITVDAQGRLTAASSGAAISLTADVTGTLPIANGGTGQTTTIAAFNGLSPLTTKGDLVVNDGTNDVRLAVGTNGQVLSANSAQASGLQWITPTNGTVTSVSGTAPIVVATGTTTPAISVNAATTSAQGVVQVGAGIAVTTGTISADPANFPSAVPVNKGGTGVTSFTANRLLASNGTGTAISYFNCALGQLVTFDASGVMGCTTYSSSGFFANGGNTVGANANLGTDDNYALNIETNNTTRMTVTNTGLVGVGVTAPTYLMDIQATTPTLRLKSASNDATGATIKLTEDLAENGSFIRYKATTNTMDFGMLESGVEVPSMSIDRATGNVGIGAAAPLTKVHVSGAVDGDVTHLQLNTNDTGTLARSIFQIGTAQTGTRYGYLSHQGAGYTASGAVKPRTTVLAGTDTGGLNLMTNNQIGLWVGSAEKVSVTSSAVEVEGTFNLGTVNPVNTGTLPGYGDKLMFQGGPSSATQDSILTDPLWMGRYNLAADSAEVRVNISDNAQASDAFAVGWSTAGGVWTQLMRVQSDGKVGVGITPAYKFQVGGELAAQNGYGDLLYFGGDGGGSDLEIGTTQGTRNTLVFYNRNLGTFMDISARNVTYTGSLTPSDRRLKTDIKTLDGSLDKILRVEGVSYKYKDELKYTSGVQYGVIAQQVEKVFPDLVNTDDKGMKKVNYMGFISPVIEAVKQFYTLWFNDSQKIHKELDQQKRQIASLEEENQALKVKVQEIDLMKKALCEKDPNLEFCKK